MAINSTTLGSILNRMNRYASISTIEEINKVQDIDEGVRTLKRNLMLPWTLQKSSIRVFDSVLEYPIPDDYNALGYVDNPPDTQFQTVWNNQGERADLHYTSLRQFYESSLDSNSMAEIWDANVRYIGIKYNFINGTPGQLLNSAELLSDWTASGDAGTPVLDNVFYKEGNSSIRVPITLSSGIATIKNIITPISNINYKQFYHFKWIYLSTIPTNIELRLQTDDTNYLSQVLTTQFSGQPFKAGQWNLIAYDLNTATQTGTFNSNSIGSEKLVITGLASGNCYVDSSYIRQWTLMDFWYYSKNTIIASGGITASKSQFIDSNNSYNLLDALVGEEEWIDVIMYDAIFTGLSDKENPKVKDDIIQKRAIAWAEFQKKYPDMVYLITTTDYSFESDFLADELTDTYNGQNN